MKTLLVVALLVAGLALPTMATAESDCAGGPIVCLVIDCPSDPNVDRPCHLRAIETAQRLVDLPLP